MLFHADYLGPSEK